jgi:Domain of unknown function (DUF4157)
MNGEMMQTHTTSLDPITRAADPAATITNTPGVSGSPIAPSAPSLILQAKLQVGAVNDPLETEADQAASEFLSWSAGGEVARVTDEGEGVMLSRATEADAGDMTGSFDVSADVEGRIDSARGGGKALPDRDKFESFFGADLSAVRVHEGPESADLNRSIAARAFTTGTDVFLGEGASTSDHELMAHELTHVVQQTGS